MVLNDVKSVIGRNIAIHDVEFGFHFPEHIKYLIVLWVTVLLLTDIAGTTI